ncbi:MAG: lysophospholipase [Pirellulales bacterium]|nr:lysophospholipase [Pirellulales bacterium]
MTEPITMVEREWRPQGEASAVVVIVHGFTEHGGRFGHVAEAFVRAGWAVYAPDLKGHGRSPGERVWVERFEEYLDDVAGYFESVIGREPGRPVFALGHSMGGTILVQLAIENRLPVRGLVLSAAALRIAPNLFPLLRRIAGLMSRWFPRLRVLRLGTGRLSRDPDNVQRFRDDPLVHHGAFPVRIGAEILDAAAAVEQDMESVRVPLLILHGTGDAIVDCGGSRALADRAGSMDKTLKLHNGLYHDLLGEPEREQIIAEIVTWISARV